MNQNTVNPCSRCGKPRQMTKTWQEEVQTYSGTSTVTHSSYVCPDEKCQKKVDSGLAEQKRLSQEREQYAQERADARAAELAKPRKKIS